MSSQIKVSCFTDLVGSTPLNETLGNRAYMPIVEEHLLVGETLVQHTSGSYVKNTGDGHMAEFDSPEDAVNFAVRFQEYYQNQPCLNRPAVDVKAGLYLGAVAPLKDDFFGVGANRAARIQGKANSGEVVVNKLMVDQLASIWSRTTTDKYFDSMGLEVLKGVNDPTRQELFSFDWRLFRQDRPSDSLANMVNDHFQKAGIEQFNLSVGDLAKPGVVIWPIVPRDLVTAIHRGQTEIIRLLALLGWRITILVADCGAKIYDRSRSDEFRSKVERYLEFRNINPVQAQYMSALYEPKYAGYEHLQSIFRTVSSDLSLGDLLDINNKTYQPDVQEKLKQAPTLDFLRPALSVAAVLHLAKQSGQKVIVVAGQDEQRQWERFIRLSETRPYLGIIMNPILKLDAIYQDRQKRDWPIWDSREALKRQMESEGNLASWLFRLHLFTSVFPMSTVSIAEVSISPQDWTDELNIPEIVNKDALVQKAWQLLDPQL